MQGDNYTRWENSDEDLLYYLKEAVEKIKNNCGIRPPHPYITGMVNYDEYIKALKECSCGYFLEINPDKIIISNVIDPLGGLKEKYPNIYYLFEISGSIMFIKPLQTSNKAP